MVGDSNIIRDVGVRIIDFLLLSDKYFEDLTNYELRDTYILRFLEKYLKKEDWLIEKSGIWFFCLPMAKMLPDQGWKIHVSASNKNYGNILKKILPILSAERVAFKITVDTFIFKFINSKNYDRAQSGKFITIYPESLRNFRNLIEKLYKTTYGLEGTYILSDKPYKDSKVIYYRYGGFSPRFKLNIYGEKLPVISSPQGKLEIDWRVPYPNFPSWIVDPFPIIYQGDEEEDIVLKNFYKVRSVISFSNSGGVYIAKGIDENTYILKEARPHIYLPTSPEFDSEISAKDALLKEYGILNKLKNTGYVPKPIEIFEEEEHLFLVLEYFDGVPLSSFRSRPDFCIVLSKSGIEFHKKEFLKKFFEITYQLIDALKKFHEQGIIIRDISPNNILINSDTLELKFIDFESSVDLSSFEKDKIVYMFTPGFFPPSKNYPSLCKKDDYYSLGAVLYSTIIPITPIFNFSKSSKRNILNEIFSEFELPCKLRDFILNLLKDSDLNRLDISRINKKYIEKLFESNPCKKRKNKTRYEIRRDVLNTLVGIANKILSNLNLDRRDTLFPADYRVFITNPLNIAYGAMGPLYLIYKYKGSIPQKIIDWVLSHKIDNEHYPPSFYAGLSGIAYTFSEIGYIDKGEEIMNLVYSSPLTFKGVDIFYGAAGWGLSSLYFYHKTKKELYLDQALRAADFLVKKAVKLRDTVYWRNIDGEIYHGYLHGSSGIGYFLFLVYLTTGKKEYLDFSLRAINYEIQNLKIVEDYLSLPKYQKVKDITMPYFQFGSSGLGMVLIRMWKKLDIPIFKFLAHHISKDCSGKFAGYPTLFRGLSGLGQFLLDMYYFTREDDYLDLAYQTASGIMLYKVVDREGVCFPGEELLRLSCDYGIGSAGVGLFLYRLLNITPREFMVDEIYFPVGKLRRGGHGNDKDIKIDQRK